MDRDTHHRFYWSIDGGNEERSSDGRKDVVQNSRLNSEPLAEAGARTDLEMCFQIFFTVRDGTGSDGKQSRFSAMPSSMHVVWLQGHGWTRNAMVEFRSRDRPR